MADTLVKANQLDYNNAVEICNIDHLPFIDLKSDEEIYTHTGVSASLIEGLMDRVEPGNSIKLNITCLDYTN